jgi:hypothetical protein
MGHCIWTLCFIQQSKLACRSPLAQVCVCVCVCRAACQKLRKGKYWYYQSSETQYILSIKEKTDNIDNIELCFCSQAKERLGRRGTRLYASLLVRTSRIKGTWILWMNLRCAADGFFFGGLKMLCVCCISVSIGIIGG